MAPSQINLLNIESYNLSYFKTYALSGIIDESLLPRLRELCLAMLRADQKDFIIDLSSTIKISKKVLELFADVAKKLQILEGKLLIMGMNSHLLNQMRSATELDPNLGYFADETEATRYIETTRQYYCF